MCSKRSIKYTHKDAYSEAQFPLTNKQLGVNSCHPLEILNHHVTDDGLDVSAPSLKMPWALSRTLWPGLFSISSCRTLLGHWVVHFGFFLIFFTSPSVSPFITSSHHFTFSLFFLWDFLLSCRLHSFHVKSCTFGLSRFVLTALKKKRKRKGFTNPANKSYSNSRDCSKMSAQK